MSRFARPMAGIPCLSRDQEQKEARAWAVDSRPVAHHPHSVCRMGSRAKKDTGRKQSKQSTRAPREVRLRLVRAGARGRWVLVFSPRLG
jgi:hypothetical protein